MPGLAEALIALLSATAALLARFANQKRVARRITVTETVDAPVLDQFLKLTTQVTEIRLNLESARKEIAELREQIAKYVKDEAAYQAELHAKDEQLECLRADLFEAQDQRDSLSERVAHLEDLCRRAGINGDEG